MMRTRRKIFNSDFDCLEYDYSGKRDIDEEQDRKELLRAVAKHTGLTGGWNFHAHRRKYHPETLPPYSSKSYVLVEGYCIFCKRWLKDIDVEESEKLR